MIFLVVALPSLALAQDKDHSGSALDCFCTDTLGSRVELGETICLYVGGRAFTARCEMVLNNPAWRETGEGCVSSQSIQIPQPEVYPFSVDRPI